MKAENLMMQQTTQAVKPAGAGKTSSLRSAMQSKTAAQGKKAENAFDNALNDAKGAQKDVRADAKEAPKDNAKPTEAKDAAAKADTKPTESKDLDAKAGVDEKAVEEAAAEAANDLPKSGKKEKSAKKGDAKDGEAGLETSEIAETATTLNAMLFAMAGSAQAQTQVPAEAQTAEFVAAESGAVLPQETAQSFATGTLDALLPQDAAKEQQAAQNQQLMDMLSENGAEMRLTSEQLAGLSSKVQETAARTGQAAQPVLDEAQLAPMAQTAEPAIKAGEAALAQPETMAVLSNAAQNAPVTQDARTAAKGEKPEASKNLFAGVPLTVEDAVLDKVQTDVQQNLGDMLKRQPQRQNPQGGDALDEMTRISGGKDIEAPQAATRGEVQTGAQQAQTAANGAGAIPQGMAFTETMNAAAATEAPPVQQAQDPYNVMQQIVDQARLIRSDANTEMVIRLNPEHLGELTLRVAVTAGGAINATFHTENAQVRGLLESSMIQLKQELQQQGLKVNNVDVQSGLSQDFFAQSQAGQQGYQQSQQSARNRAADRRAFENDADALTVNTAVSGAAATENTANVGDSDGVNYLV